MRKNMFKENLTIVLKKRHGAAWRRFIKRAGAIVTALLLLLTVLPPVTVLAAGGTPTVTASAASNVNSTACTLNGSISGNGGDGITEYGFYYGLFPAIQHDADHKVQLGASDYTGSISTNLTGLTLGATYYFQAYATNTVGTAYSNTLSVTLAGANSAIASADNTVFHASAQGSFTIIATGDPLPTISETGALPSGVTFTDNGNGTATLSGKPAIGTDGSWPITITAHNTIPSDATQSFTLTVALPEPPYFSGRGTEADPWLIQSAADLAQMRDLVNSQTSPWADAGVYYKLTQNIDLSAYATATITATGLYPWEDATPGIGWTPIGYGAFFKGVFDGNGKTVSGLYINYPLDGGQHMGLFGMIYTDAVVKNLGVVKCDVTGYRYVGGLVGWSAGGIIENCYVTGRISCWRGAGGLVGKFYNYDSNTTLANGYIKNCYTDCTITGGGGGLVECLTDGTITNCYSAGVVVDGQGSVAGGIVGWLDSGIMTNDPDAYSTVKDCVALQLRNAGIYPYDNDEIHARGRIYGYIYENTPPAFSGNYAWSGMTGFNYPLASSTNDGQNGANLDTADACVAAIRNIGFTDFTAADLPAYITGYFTGGGTESDPYQISTVDDLENLALDVNNGVNFDGKYFKLMNDLDLAGSYRNWSPIGSDMRTYNDNAADTYKFNGIFDGNGKTIRHLSNSAGYGTVDSDGHYAFVGQYYMGLFGYIGSGGTVKNLNLTDVSLNGYAYYVGGIAGECDGVIDHCNVSGSIQTRGYTTDMHQVSVGGIVGAGVGSKLVISNCSAAGQIGSAAYLVGPTGDSYVGAYYAGGVAGMVLINDDGETVYYTGGQAGLVTNSSFSGDVLKSGYSSGGLIGVNYATVTNCHTEGSVQSSGTLTGGAAGLIGYNRAGLIENCYSTSTVTSSGGAAGFIGVNDYLYFYTADDQTHAHYIGGTIRNCYSTGQVTCNSNNGNGSCMASGFLTSNSGTLEYCYSTGNVNGDGQTAGFVGNNRVINNTLKGVITNCYCTGTVSGPAEPPSTSYSYCAVFAAVNYSVIQNCIALNQSISGTYTHIGRMAGYNYGTNFSFIDNYAWSGMTVNGSTVTGTTTDNNGGDLADWAVIRPKLAGIGFTNVARPAYIPLGEATDITFTAEQAGGTSGTADSTGIVLTFSETVTSLTADDITITNDSGSVTKGTLSGSDTIWMIALDGVASQGDVTVSVADFGSFHVTTVPQTVAVYKAVVLTPITLQTAVADGAAGTTTSTKIDLTFDTAIAGLTASGITITDGTGAAVKGALTGSGTSWSIALTSVATQGNVTVAVVAPAGYSISGSPKTVAVYKAVVPTAVTLQTAVADGVADTITSTKIDLTFDTAIAGLTASDITITSGSGAAVKGVLTGSGTSWSIALTSVTTQGNVSVAVSAPAGYSISGSPKTVAVYKAVVPTAVTLLSAAADGVVDTTTSTKIDFIFDTAIAGLTASDITITDGTGAAVKGDLTGSGTNWSIALTSVTTQGNVSVAVAAPSGYTISGSPKTIAVYKAAVPIVIVTSVTVAPPTVSVQKGTTQTFTAAVNGTNSPAQTVAWSVYGNTSGSTTINASGLLAVAADETAATLTVTATSMVDNSKSGTATVTVTTTPPAFVAVTDITSVPATATAGMPLTLTGTVAPADATNQTVAWSVYNAGDTGASIVGNTLSTTAAGIVVVRATITNGLTESTDYTQDFNITVTAALVTTYTVTASVGSGGSISPDGSVSVTEGSSQTFTITSNSGYRINSVTVDGVNQGAITTYTFTNVTADHTITATFTRTSGGDGGGGGGSSSTPATPATPTYNADVKAGNSTETTLPVIVDKDNGTASTDVGSQKFTSSGTIITVPAIPDVNAYSVGIPVPDLSTSDVQGTLTLHTDNGSVTVPSNMLTGVSDISGRKAEITIGQGNKENLPEDVKAAIGDRPLVQLTLSIDGKQTDWNNHNAPVTVSIPYTPTAAERANPESIVVWYIDGSGKVVTVPNGHYDPATGRIIFDTTHFSDYAVAYNPVSFNDVSAGAWYNKAVGFIAARGITSGTGNGKYSPEAKLTRGEFIVLVMRSYDIAPDTDLANNFSDAGNTYYTGYLAAAKRLGISSGVGNNMYAPGKEITRQEMFTLLYNVLKVIGQLPGTHGRAVGEANDQPQGDSGKSLSSFTDAGQIASWAKDAMTLLVETGTIGGNNGMLTPTSTTTRAEMAQVVYNLLSK